MADKFSPALQAELDYRLDLMAETAEVDGAAFVRDDAAIETAFSDMEGAGITEFTAEMRAWYIAKGVFTVMSEDEIKNTSVMGRNRRVWDFKIKGVAYKFRQHVPGYFTEGEN